MIIYETYAWHSCPECHDSARAGRTYFFTTAYKAQQFWEESKPGLKWERLVTSYVARGEGVNFPVSRWGNKHFHTGHTHKTGYNILRHEVK